ncbi:RNA polymerase sigma factor [Ancylomarina longa]|uniref:RNA polymerase sigma-70 factor n=1 Tax=Ancylomarina longa TaxID=2487017 RepID=A0A434AG70_9BACT|nr:RNA polymerase sigma-70 factor [Ancylomarina longa]RUT73372.1 RNA polymerase sigma-70 factor [Ancylomarina longa]
MKDIERIKEFNKGNRIAFNLLFKENYSNICSFASHFLSDNAQIEDFVQEAFVKLWEKRASFDHIGAVKSFLHIVVRNKCLNHIRDNKYTYLLDKKDYEKIISEDFFLEKVIEEEYYSKLNQFIQTLPPKTQQVLRLSMQGLTQREIADELGIEISTVKSHKKLAYRSIRNGFEVLVVALLLG